MGDREDVEAEIISIQEFSTKDTSAGATRKSESKAGSTEDNNTNSVIFYPFRGMWKGNGILHCLKLGADIVYVTPLMEFDKMRTDLLAREDQYKLVLPSFP